MNALRVWQAMSARRTVLWITTLRVRGEQNLLGEGVDIYGRRRGFCILAECSLRM